MSKIVWRDDIADAPKDQRLLMIATSLALNHISELPEIVVAHWHQNGRWVASENHRGERPALEPIYWAVLPDLPSGIISRPLTGEDVMG
jgi:hypothetical protein